MQLVLVGVTFIFCRWYLIFWWMLSYVMRSGTLCYREWYIILWWVVAHVMGVSPICSVGS